LKKEKKKQENQKEVLYRGNITINVFHYIRAKGPNALTQTLPTQQWQLKLTYEKFPCVLIGYLLFQAHEGIVPCKAP
jgi:hypothetical protein